MLKMEKDGQFCTADRDQRKLMEEAGWKVARPGAKPAADNGSEEKESEAPAPAPATSPRRRR